MCEGRRAFGKEYKAESDNNEGGLLINEISIESFKPLRALL